MPRPKLADVTRFHHLNSIPPEYTAVLYSQQLKYSSHAKRRYASRVETLAPTAARPTHIDANGMQLLAADVADGKVVMQVWRAPLEGVEHDIVLAVSDQGKVATVWVAERGDPDGVSRPKPSRPELEKQATNLGAVFRATVSLPIEPGNEALWGAISTRRSRTAPFDALLNEVSLRPG